MSPGPLSDLAVLELGEMVAAPYCGKLLADLGADVLKVEPPDGDPARRRGPFPDDVPHPERSGLFLYLNTSKRAITLSLETESGREIFRKLLARADVLIEDRAPGVLASLGLGPDRLAAVNPRLIVISLTPFGQTGPYRRYRAHHLNLYHASGHSASLPMPEGSEGRAPPRAGGYLGEYDAGLTAALAALAAVLGRGGGGRGAHVDVSKQEALMCLERIDLGRAINDPASLRRRMVGGLTRAKDGYFVITPIQDHQWQALVRVMSEPAWARADWCQTEAGRMEHRDEIRPRIEAWAAGLTRDEIYHLTQAEGAPTGPVRDVAEVRAWKQAEARGFFAEIEHPEAGMQVYPTSPYRFSRTPWAATPAPRLGQHDAEARCDPPRLLTRRALPRRRVGDPRRKATPAAGGPLAGIRVVDFTWAWAGPHATLLLALLGAEVIKIESRARLDHSRLRSIAAGTLDGGPDASPLFNDLNLNKLSVSLDLRKAESRQIVRRLVAVSDVAVQNMRPGVLDRLELGYEALRAVKPDLVMLSSSAVGAEGPERSYVGYAPTFAALSGIASITGYPDLPPMPLTGSVDLRVGTMSAFAILAALHHRERSGEGQHVDLSSTEVMSSMMGEAFLEYSMNGRVPGRAGNRDGLMAPHGCYPCRGEGSWITVAVGSEAEWSALKAAIGDTDLEDEAFADPLERWRQQERLDGIVARWTRRREPAEAVATLQAAGVPSAPLLSGPGLERDPHVRSRGILETVTHPLIGERVVVGAPWRFEGDGVGIRRPGPRIGQHNDYVLGEILGMPAAEIERLAREGVLH